MSKQNLNFINYKILTHLNTKFHCLRQFDGNIFPVYDNLAKRETVLKNARYP